MAIDLNEYHTAVNEEYHPYNQSEIRQAIIVQRSTENTFTKSDIIKIITDNTAFLRKDVEVKVIEQGAGLFIVSFGLMTNPVPLRIITMNLNAHFLTADEFTDLFVQGLTYHIPAFEERNMIEEKTEEEVLIDEVEKSNISDEFKQKLLSRITRE